MGQADVVEIEGSRITPIEYKRGKPKKDNCDTVQLCAQALCMEEMFKTEIEVGYLFYGKRQRRKQVKFDKIIREQTLAAAARLRHLIDKRETPPATRMPKCDSCSLERICLPDSMRLKTGAARFIERSLNSALENNGPMTDDVEAQS